MTATGSPYEGATDSMGTGPANPLRASLAAKSHTVGPWVMSTDSSTVDLLARTGLDFLVFDCQHGPHDLATIGPLLRTAATRAKPTLVRVPSSEPSTIMRALDLGAAGVIVPMVDSAPEAERASAATRYPPLGNRSYGPLQPAPGDVFDPDDGPVVLIMIETRGGLEHADEIAALPGVDGLFIGPIDLALAIDAISDGDLQAGLSSPELHQAVGVIAQAAADNRKILSGAVFSPEHARALAPMGMTMQVLGTDTGWLTAGADDVIKLADSLR